MSRDSSCTARNISYVFRVLLGWALYPSSSLFHPPSLSPSRSLFSTPLLSSDVWCHFLPTWHGSFIRKQSSSHSYTIPPPPHPRPHSLPEKCWVTDQNLANLPLLLILSFFFFFFFPVFLYQTAKFRLTPELSNFNFWCISTSHSLRHCLSTAGRWKW